MIYSNLKKRMCVLFLVILVVLLAFSAGCIQTQNTNNANDDLMTTEIPTTIPEDLNREKSQDYQTQSVNLGYFDKLASFELSVPKEIYKNATNHNEFSFSNNLEKYYTDIITQIDEMEFVKSAAKSISDAAAKSKINEVDLCVRYVQTIPYEEGSSYVKTPIETTFDKSGDCDEKSLLGAAILSELGYDVALLVFEPTGTNIIGHCAIGIKCNRNPNYAYEYGGYCYVEPNNISFIGDSWMFYDDPTLNTRAEVIKIGSGNKIYEYDKDILKIVNGKETCQRNAEKIYNDLEFPLKYASKDSYWYWVVVGNNVASTTSPNPLDQAQVDDLNRQRISYQQLGEYLECLNFIRENPDDLEGIQTILIKNGII